MFTVSIDLGNFAQKINTNIATVVRAAATELYGKIVQRTPVDTGYCRRNWQVTVDVPASGTVGSPLEKASGGTAIAPPPPPNLPPDALHVFITNNVEYVEALENGHSRQAPNGFVAISVAELEAEIGSIQVEGTV
jgi:hypothetical protein